ncbi:4-(cytidine 5'-diphospho)-2-C-methyl-D-erythritol kinase [Agrococcus casei]|uniref:4-(cytidine 5'-diphospho)-2-C-methyl-D-erythritol kinase n=1 Tax=Agrococcus casei TaxID=343512 RepID=UPI003F9BE50B
MTDRVVRAKAPAKINVFLGVGSLRSDGYHDLSTGFLAVSLFEHVEVRAADDFSVTLDGSIDTSSVPLGESNLAIRAARAVAEACGATGGARIRIEKHVPIAGGMGGGSADAAATLVACNELWNAGLSRDELLALAADLGADVPFALTGGVAMGTGRGDQLSPALHRGKMHWVLVPADGELSTPVVFHELDKRRWSQQGELERNVTQPIVSVGAMQALRLGDVRMLAETMHNDLQAPALRLMPRLVGTLELGERMGALAGIVSGSGPTCAFLCEDEESAVQLVQDFCDQSIRAVHVTGPVAGAKITGAKVRS